MIWPVIGRAEGMPFVISTSVGARLVQTDLTKFHFCCVTYRTLSRKRYTFFFFFSIRLAKIIMVDYESTGPAEPRVSEEMVLWLILYLVCKNHKTASARWKNLFTDHLRPKGKQRPTNANFEGKSRRCQPLLWTRLILNGLFMTNMQVVHLYLTLRHNLRVCVCVLFRRRAELNRRFGRGCKGIYW